MRCRNAFGERTESQENQSDRLPKSTPRVALKNRVCAPGTAEIVRVA